MDGAGAAEGAALTVDPNTILPWLLAALLGADKGLAALGRVGRLPAAFGRWDRHRAEALVAEEQREFALAELAKKADAILAQLVPNGGTSVIDALARVEDKLDQHLVETAPIIVEHHEIKRALEAHLSLHLDGQPK